MIVTGLAWQMTTCSISRWSPSRAYPSPTAATPLSKGYSDLTRPSIFDLLSLLRPPHAFRSMLLPATAEKISFSPAGAENGATYGPYDDSGAGGRAANSVRRMTEAIERQRSTYPLFW